MAHVHSPTRPISAGFSLYFKILHSYRSRLTIPLSAIVFVVLSARIVLAEIGVSLIGVIVDSTGLPVSGATIITDPGELTAQSDLSGTFAIGGMLDGRYNIVVTHLGFAPYRSTSIRIRKGEPTRMRVMLTQVAITLPESQIVTKLQQSSSIADSKIFLVRKDWEATGARTLTDALRQAPGITVLEGGGITRISVRGSPSHMVEIDRDGVPLHDISTGESDLSTIRLEELDAIGVEPTGAGGKVHLISREIIHASSSNSQIVNGTIEANSTNGIRADAGAGFRIGQTNGEFDFGANANEGKYSYKLNDGSVHPRINNYTKSLSGNARFGRQIGFAKITGAVYLNKSNRGIPNLIYDVPTPDAKLNSQQVTLRIGMSANIKNNSLEAILYTRHYDGGYNNPEFQVHPESGQILHFNPEHTTQNGSRTGLSVNVLRKVWFTDARFNMRATQDKFIGKDITNNVVNIGVGYGSAARLTYEAEVGLRIPKSTGVWEYMLTPGLTVKKVMDRGGHSIEKTLPNLAGSVERSFGWGLTRMSFLFQRSIIVPSFNALLMNESHYAVGNRNLRPEKGNSAEVGLEVNKNFDGGSSQLTITPFKRTIQDLIVWQRNSLAKYYPDNIAETYARGVEVSLSISLLDDKISAFGSYIYNRSTIETPGDINQGNFTPLNPLYSGSSSINYHSDRWSATLGGRWISRRFSTMSNFDPISTAGMGLPPYSVYDIEFSYLSTNSKAKMTYTAEIENIFNSEYRIVERSPMPGRVAFLRVMAELR